MPGVWVAAPESDSLTVVFQDRSLSQVCLTLTGGNCSLMFMLVMRQAVVLCYWQPVWRKHLPSIPHSIRAVDCSYASW